ncbi:MAG: hypothetical protein HFJ27_03555 [Clostridia bacterium]|nr:hypothetical protein [Clostridia bacterium]
MLLIGQTVSNYLEQELSENLRKIINLYYEDPSAIEYLNTTMKCVIPIIKNDPLPSYISQIILPIMHNGILQGLLIFVNEQREYIESNLDFAKTTKRFVEEFSLEAEETY